MANKLPALHFYTGDWFKDVGVQSLGFFERGVWLEMLFHLHNSEERGVFTVNGKPMKPESIAQVIGVDNHTFEKCLTILLDSGVASKRESDGAIFSRRMVRDEELRRIKVKAGKKGGNPRLLNHRDNHRVNHKVESMVNHTPENEYEDKDVSSRGRGAGKGNREPDLLWDAVAAHFYPNGIAPSQRSLVGAVVRDLRAMNAQPSEIKPRADNYATHMPECPCTPKALAKHWELCSKPKGSKDPSKVRDADMAPYMARVIRYDESGRQISGPRLGGEKPPGGGEQDGTAPAERCA